MSYRKHDPAVYVVGWRANDVIKAGFTCNQRWRKFTLRGAELLSLQFFDDSTDAFAREQELEDALSAVGVQAFAHKDQEASDLLGSDCGGYLECHRLTSGGWAAFLAEHCPLAMPTSIAQQQWHGRTDVTDGLRTASPTRANTSSVTRGRAYGFAEETR